MQFFAKSSSRFVFYEKPPLGNCLGIELSRSNPLDCRGVAFGIPCAEKGACPTRGSVDAHRSVAGDGSPPLGGRANRPLPGEPETNLDRRDRQRLRTFLPKRSIPKSIKNQNRFLIDMNQSSKETSRQLSLAFPGHCRPSEDYAPARHRVHHGFSPQYARGRARYLWRNACRGTEAVAEPPLRNSCSHGALAAVVRCNRHRSRRCTWVKQRGTFALCENRTVRLLDIAYLNEECICASSGLQHSARTRPMSRSRSSCSSNQTV